MIVFRLPFLILLYLLGTLRDTLPDTEDEAWPFLAGMAWMFAVQMLMLVVTSWLWLLSVRP